MKKKTVRQLRLEKGWSQQKLADKLNISNRTVSAKELGNSYFTEKEISMIAKLFKVDAKEIKK